jgi:hypothetical protein
MKKQTPSVIFKLDASAPSLLQRHLRCLGENQLCGFLYSSSTTQPYNTALNTAAAFVSVEYTVLLKIIFQENIPASNNKF